MGETRGYYGTFSVETPHGNVVGRDTFTITGEPHLPAYLGMRQIKEVEAGFLEATRKKVPDAITPILTWWTEIAAEDTSPTDGGTP